MVSHTCTHPQSHTHACMPTVSHTCMHISWSHTRAHTAMVSYTCTLSHSLTRMHITTWSATHVHPHPGLTHVHTHSHGLSHVHIHPRSHTCARAHTLLAPSPLTPQAQRLAWPGQREEPSWVPPARTRPRWGLTGRQDQVPVGHGTPMAAADEMGPLMRAGPPGVGQGAARSPYSCWGDPTGRAATQYVTCNRGRALPGLSEAPGASP